MSGYKLDGNWTFNTVNSFGQKFSRFSGEWHSVCFLQLCVIPKWYALISFNAAVSDLWPNFYLRLTILFLAYAVSSWTISLSPNDWRVAWLWCKQYFTIRQLTAFPPTFSVQDMFGCNLNLCICSDFLYFSHKLIRKSTGKLWVNLLHETRHA